jgi:ferritin-like metal-binding protein YciE
MPAKKKRSKSASGGRTQKTTPEPMELLHTELSEIYSAENQLMKAAPRISKAIDSEPVRELMNRRLEQGEQLIADLENVFQEMGQNPNRKKNVAAEGLLRDTLDHIQEIQRGPSLDAVLIGAVQKLQHYCIAAWGTSRAFGEALGQETTVTVMERVLEEGKDLDEEFTRLAEEEINPAMLEAGEEVDDETARRRRGRRGSSGDEARA